MVEIDYGGESVIINRNMITYIFRQNSGVLQLIRKFNNDKFINEPRKDSRTIIITEDDKQDTITPDLRDIENENV